jgi:hypothetical protein
MQFFAAQPPKSPFPETAAPERNETGEPPLPIWSSRLSIQ